MKGHEHMNGFDDLEEGVTPPTALYEVLATRHMEIYKWVMRTIVCSNVQA